MGYRVLSSLFFLAALIGCSTDAETEKEKPVIEYATPEPKPPATVDLTTYKTRTGKSFIMTVKPISGSLNRITVQGMGFPEGEEIFSIRDADPFESAQIADIDKDGFDELYVITRAMGSGSYATLRGYASYRDKSYGEIVIPAFEGLNYGGFRGHYTVRFTSDGIAHMFPVYNEGDVNSQPTGGTRVVLYKLEKGEAALMLTVRSVTNPQ